MKDLQALNLSETFQEEPRTLPLFCTKAREPNTNKHFGPSQDQALLNLLKQSKNIQK